MTRKVELVTCDAESGRGRTRLVYRGFGVPAEELHLCPGDRGRLGRPANRPLQQTVLKAIWNGGWRARVVLGRSVSPHPIRHGGLL